MRRESLFLKVPPKRLLTFDYSIMVPQIPSLKRKFESLLIISSSTQEEAVGSYTNAGMQK